MSKVHLEPVPATVGYEWSVAVELLIKIVHQKNRVHEDKQHLSGVKRYRQKVHKTGRSAAKLNILICDCYNPQPKAKKGIRYSTRFLFTVYALAIYILVITLKALILNKLGGIFIRGQIWSKRLGYIFLESSRSSFK